MLLAIRTISRPIIRATVLLAGITITALAGYSILGAYEGLAAAHLATLIAYWSAGLLTAAAVATLLFLATRRASRTEETEEAPWADIPDDLPMVAQFDASLRDSRDDQAAEDAPWADIPDDLPIVAQFDESVRASAQGVLSENDAPWADFPDDLPAVAQFDEYLRTYNQNAASTDDAPWTDFPDDLPAVAQFDEYLRTYSQEAVPGRSWKRALVRWIQEVPDAALARREYLRNTEYHEYARFYGASGQLATAGVNAMAANGHGQQQLGDDQAMEQRAISRRILIRRSSDSQLLQ
jgi:hypothetical protein